MGLNGSAPAPAEFGSREILCASALKTCLQICLEGGVPLMNTGCADRVCVCKGGDDVFVCTHKSTLYSSGLLG